MTRLSRGRLIVPRTAERLLAPRPSLAVAAAATLLILLFWICGQDGVRRIWVELPTKRSGTVQALCIVPMEPAPAPVLLYTSDGSDRTAGFRPELEQFAPFGFASVSVDLSGTDVAARRELFRALAGYLAKQPWARSGVVAWVGIPLDCREVAAILRENPSFRPVAFAGGLERWRAASQTADLGDELKHILLVQDRPFSETRWAVHNGEELASWNQKSSLTLLEQGPTGRGFPAYRQVTERAIAEWCRDVLTKTVRPAARPSAPPRPNPWLIALPALAWIALAGPRLFRAEAGSEGPARLLKIAGMVAFSLAALRLGGRKLLDHIPASPFTLKAARACHFTDATPEELGALAGRIDLSRLLLGPALDDIELAHYDSRELAPWRIPEDLYLEYVASPVSSEEPAAWPDWRMALWGYLYPWIRSIRSPAEVAENVAELLRRRITVTSLDNPPGSFADCWREGVADPAEFDSLYASGLRAVGIPSRLGTTGRAEFWDAGAWQPAPRPSIERLEDSALTAADNIRITPPRPDPLASRLERAAAIPR